MSREIVKLWFPAKAEYLTAIRLLAGSVAGQAGFDVEQIEDIKTALSEACLLLLPCREDELDLELWADQGFHAIVRARRQEKECAQSPEREFSLFMLEALTDRMEFFQIGEECEYRLYKSLQL